MFSKKNSEQMNTRGLAIAPRWNQTQRGDRKKVLLSKIQQRPKSSVKEQQQQPSRNQDYVTKVVSKGPTGENFATSPQVKLFTKSSDGGSPQQNSLPDPSPDISTDMGQARAKTTKEPMKQSEEMADRFSSSRLTHNVQIPPIAHTQDNTPQQGQDGDYHFKTNTSESMDRGQEKREVSSTQHREAAELTNQGSQAFLGAKPFQFEESARKPRKSSKATGAIDDPKPSGISPAELLNRPDSPILPQDSEMYYQMYDMRREAKSKKTQPPILSISQKPQVPFYEKLAVNLDLAMKPKLDATARHVERLESARSVVLKTENMPSPLQGMPIVLNHHGVSPLRYQQYVRQIFVRHSEVTNTTANSFNSHSVFEKNRFKNKFLAQKKPRRMVSGFFGDEAALTGGSYAFKSKSQKQRFYKAVRQLKRLRSKLIERPSQEFEIAEAFVAINTELRCSSHEIKRFVECVKNFEDPDNRIRPGQSLRAYILEIIFDEKNNHPLNQITEETDQKRLLKTASTPVIPKLRRGISANQQKPLSRLEEQAMNYKRRVGHDYRHWAPRMEQASAIPKLKRESGQLEGVLVDYLHADRLERSRLRSSLESSLPSPGPLRRVKSEFQVGGGGAGGGAGKDQRTDRFSVTSYQSKLEKAQASAAHKTQEVAAQNMLVNKDISDIQRKKLLLEHIMLERAMNKNVTRSEVDKLMNKPLLVNP